MKKNTGITLIALVITIIVLLILAGVAITSLTGENSIMKKASDARENTDKAAKEEEFKMIIEEALIEMNIEPIDADTIYQKIVMAEAFSNKWVDDDDYDSDINHVDETSDDKLTGIYKGYEFLITEDTNKNLNVELGNKVEIESGDNTGGDNTGGDDTGGDDTGGDDGRF